MGFKSLVGDPLSTKGIVYRPPQVRKCLHKLLCRLPSDAHALHRLSVDCLSPTSKRLLATPSRFVGRMPHTWHCRFSSLTRKAPHPVPGTPAPPWPPVCAAGMRMRFPRAASHLSTPAPVGVFPTFPSQSCCSHIFSIPLPFFLLFCHLPYTQKTHTVTNASDYRMHRTKSGQVRPNRKIRLRWAKMATLHNCFILSNRMHHFPIRPIIIEPNRIKSEKMALLSPFEPYFCMPDAQLSDLVQF